MDSRSIRLKTEHFFSNVVNGTPRSISSMANPQNPSQTKNKTLKFPNPNQMDPTVDLLSSIYPSPSPSSSLAWTWVLQTLAHSQNVDSSLLQFMISSLPNLKSYSSESAREAIALKCLEDWLRDPQWGGPPLPNAPELLQGEDRSCEELFFLLLKMAKDSDDVEHFKHELQQFILRKRASLVSDSDDMMKNSIQTEENMFQEDPSDPKEHTEQQNGKELQLLNQISVTVNADIGKDSQGYLSRFRQEAWQLNDMLKLSLQKISAAHTSAEEEILHDYSKFDNRSDGRTVRNNVNRIEVVQANGSNKIMDPLLIKSTAVEGESSISIVPSDNIKFQVSSSIINQKVKKDSDEKVKVGICMNCGEGGLLLHCSSHNCFITFHAQCIDSSVNFDEKGNVYCTSCSFTQAAIAYYRAKERYSEAKKAFASWSIKHSKRQQQKVPHVGALKETNQARNMDCHKNTPVLKKNSHNMEHNNEKEGRIQCNTGNLPRVDVENQTTEDEAMPSRNLVGDEPGIQSVLLANVKPQKCLDMPKNNPEKVKNNLDQKTDDLRVEKAEGFENTRRHSKRIRSKRHMNYEIVKKHLAETNASTDLGKTSRITETYAASHATMRSETCLNDDLSDLHEETLMKQDIHINGHDIQNPHMEMIVEPLVEEGIAKGNILDTSVPGQHLHTSTENHIGSPSFCNDREGNKSSTKEWIKRKRKYWTPVEEQALKEEVERVAPTCGTIPWAQIWISVKHVFHENRTPQDLKDKWRNMMLKEARGR